MDTARSRETLLSEGRALGEALTARYHLALRRPRQAGHGGNWLGSGSGSSIDFQDHRSYALGDDPRHINWQAYARTGEYSMKLYRDEVSPQVDLVLDCSPSMFQGEGKARANAAVFGFCIQSILELGASLRCYGLAEDAVSSFGLDQLRSGAWAARLPERGVQLAPNFARVPWRPRSTRIVVSDLLYPGDPGVLARDLGAQATWSALIVVADRSESQPNWQGGMKLVDSETGQEQVHYCDQAFLAEYQERYRAHFAAWRDFARRRQLSLLELEAERSLEAQFAEVGLSSGVIGL